MSQSQSVAADHDAVAALVLADKWQYWPLGPLRVCIGNLRRSTVRGLCNIVTVHQTENRLRAVYFMP